MAGGEPENQAQESLTARLTSVARWLADDEQLRVDVIKWVAEQTGLKPVFIRPVVNGLLAVGSRAVDHAGAAVLSHAVEGLLRIPFIERVVAGLEGLHVQGATRQQLEQQFRQAIGDDAELPLSAGLDILQATFLLQTLSRHDDVLKELRGDLASGLSQLQEQLAELARQNNLVRADLLRIPQHPGTDGILARLRFTSGLHPFIGREETLRHLGKFLAAPGSEQGDFRWMLLTAPGGFGKSRLAYELCLNPALASDNALPWHAGFLSAEDLEDLSQSVRDGTDTPRSLLIVVDYAARLPEQLAILMQRLTERAASLSHPVRLLLLERPQMGRWAQELLGSRPEPRYSHWPQRISSDSQEIPAYELPPLGDEAIVQLMRARLRDVEELASLDDEQLLGFVARVSSAHLFGDQEERRPLFALLAAELRRAAAQQQEEDSNPFDLILQRERDNWWRPAAEDDTALARCENLLALATFCGGIERRQWRELPNVLTKDGLLPRPRDFQNMRPLLERMGLRENRLPPLEPDILGEHFVLQQLGKIADCGDDMAQAFRDIAWQLGAADDRAPIFLLRALADFSDRVIEADFLAPSPAAGEQAAYAFSRAAVDVSNMVGTLLRFLWPLTAIAPADDISEEVRSFSTSLDRLFSCIDALRQQFPDNADIALHEAMAAFNVTSDAGAARNWELVKEMLRRIDALRQQFPDNADIALEEAKTAVNVTSDAGAARNWELVKEMLRRIDALRQQFPDNADIALEEAKAAVNVTKHADKAKDWEQEVKDMLRRIDVLRQQFPDNADIALHEAEAAVNVTSDVGAARNWEVVKEMLRRIDALRQQFPDNADIALREAMAALNVTSDAGAARNWELVKEMLQRIDVLRQQFPDNADIALREAMAAVNVIADADKAEDWEQEVKDMLRRIEALRQQFPDNADIALREAMAAVNVTGHADKAENWEQEVKEMLRRIDALRQQFPDNADIALAEATAAVNVTNHADKAEDWEQEVKEMLRRIDVLRQQFPDNADIALEEADAHAAHGQSRLRNNDAAEAVQPLRRALELRQEHLPQIVADKEHQKRLLITLGLYQQACEQAGQEPDWQGLEQIVAFAQRIAAANSGTPLSPWATGWRALVSG